MNAPANQNNNPMITSIDLNPPLDEEKLIVTLNDEESFGSQFDLRCLYHNAVNSLVSCDRTIKCLQKQLTSKDEQMAMLEERLVQMSLELASAMASVDILQHRLAKQGKSMSASFENDEGQNFSAASQWSEKEQEVSTVDVNSLPSSTVRCAPVRENTKRRSPSQSWSTHSHGSTSLVKNDNSVPAAESYPAPKRRGGWRLPPLSMNWRNDDNDICQEISCKIDTTGDVLRIFGSGNTNVDRKKSLVSMRNALLQEIYDIDRTTIPTALPTATRVELNGCDSSKEPDDQNS